MKVLGALTMLLGNIQLAAEYKRKKKSAVEIVGNAALVALGMWMTTL